MTRGSHEFEFPQQTRGVLTVKVMESAALTSTGVSVWTSCCKFVSFEGTYPARETHIPHHLCTNQRLLLQRKRAVGLFRRPTRLQCMVRHHGKSCLAAVPRPEVMESMGQYRGRDRGETHIKTGFHQGYGVKGQEEKGYEDRE